LLLSGVVLGATAGQSQPEVVATQHGNVTNLETKDNLRSFHAIDCVDVSSLTTDYTPADLYPAVRKCIDRGDLERGARLYAVAGVYGRFDMLRVLDESARQAIPVLQLNNLSQVDPAIKAKFQATVHGLLGTDQLPAVCSQVRKLGPPTYYPTYMTQHGMSAFTGKGGGLKPDFNAAEAWESSLAGYLHCPATPQ
jgi:hypothetical protein